MSIIGDALQRAERDGAPLDAPKPVAVPQRPVLDVPIAPPSKAVAASRPKSHATPARVRRRVSPATVVLFVLAVLTVYMLADPRWSGSNWGMDQLWVPSAQIDALTPVSIEAASSPTMTASTFGGDSISTPAASMETPIAEPVSPAPGIEQPAAAVATPDDTSRYVLSGVMLGGSTRLAVINGAIVETGQTIDGAEVVAITRRDVTLSISGRKVRIAMQAEALNRSE